MTKAELKKRLEQGETLDQILDFKWGQECMIFKADVFSVGDEIIYIPDTGLNEIPLHDPVLDPEEQDVIIGCCYTGDDFVDECDGNTEKAMDLFWYCDWQHPNSALDEICDEEDE